MWDDPAIIIVPGINVGWLFLTVACGKLALLFFLVSFQPVTFSDLVYSLL